MIIPKMLVFDLDGTLLQDDKTIPEESVKEINRLYKEYRIIPVISTARPLEIAKLVAEQGGEAFAHSHIIATNGAIVYDVAKGEYLLKKSLSHTALGQLIDMCKKYNLEFEIMTDEKEIAQAQYKYRRAEDPMYTNAGKEFAFEADLGEYIHNLPEGSVPLFAISGSNTELKDIQEKLDAIPGISRTVPNSRGEGLEYYDIMPQGVSKSEALELIAKIKKIEPEAIFTFGDGGNDIPMLTHGRVHEQNDETVPEFNRVHCEKGVFSIAPANARDSVKKVVDVTTHEDNNTGAIANFLKALRIHIETYKKLKAAGEPTIDDKRKPTMAEGSER